MNYEQSKASIDEELHTTITYDYLSCEYLSPCLKNLPWEEPCDVGGSSTFSCQLNHEVAEQFHVDESCILRWQVAQMASARLLLADSFVIMMAKNANWMTTSLSSKEKEWTEIDTDSSDWELDSKKEELRSNLTRDSPFSFGEADASSNGRSQEANDKSVNKTTPVPFQQKEAYEEELFDDSIFSEVGSTEEAENMFDDLTDEEIFGKKSESRTKELHPNVSPKIAQATEQQEAEVQKDALARTIELQVQEPDIQKDSSEKTVELKSSQGSPGVLSDDVVAVDVPAESSKVASQLNASIVLDSSSPHSSPVTPLKKGCANLAKKSAEESFSRKAFTAKPSDFSSDDGVSDSSVEYLKSE
uniref:Uncharacterized protein n=1 Tax=Ditylenchus dipsaci TaxID=166011 RepID=A0A915EPS5_9BILA